MSRLIAVLSVLVLAGCAHQYLYQPAEHATGSIGGHVAAEYQIPPTAPQGDVRLASFGLGQLAPAKGSSGSTPALHLRMVVSNNSAEPWTERDPPRLAELAIANEQDIPVQIDVAQLEPRDLADPQPKAIEEREDGVIRGPAVPAPVVIGQIGGDGEQPPRQWRIKEKRQPPRGLRSRRYADRRGCPFSKTTMLATWLVPCTCEMS